MSSKKTLKIHTNETGQNTERNYIIRVKCIEGYIMTLCPVKTPFNISAQGCGV